MIKHTHSWTEGGYGDKSWSKNDDQYPRPPAKKRIQNKQVNKENLKEKTNCDPLGERKRPRKVVGVFQSLVGNI